MPRTSRMIIPDQPTVYHVMSRTALEGLPFQAFDKDKMLEIIRKFSRLYFVDILGFCIMDNHFHILVRMVPDAYFTKNQGDKSRGQANNSVDISTALVQI